MIALRAEGTSAKMPRTNRRSLFSFQMWASNSKLPSREAATKSAASVWPSSMNDNTCKMQMGSSMCGFIRVGRRLFPDHSRRPVRRGRPRKDKPEFAHRSIILFEYIARCFRQLISILRTSPTFDEVRQCRRVGASHPFLRAPLTARMKKGL
jgi:hypothetical protein